MVKIVAHPCLIWIAMIGKDNLSVGKSEAPARPAGANSVKSMVKILSVQEATQASQAPK